MHHTNVITKYIVLLVFSLALVCTSVGAQTQHPLVANALRCQIQNNKDSALYYCQQALELNLDTFNTVPLYKMQLSIYRSNHNNIGIYTTASKLLRLAATYHNVDWEFESYLYLANAYLFVSNITQAQHYFNRCRVQLSNRKSPINSKLQYKYYENCAKFYDVKQDNKRTMLYLALMLDNAKKNKNERSIITSLAKIAGYNQDLQNINLSKGYIALAQQLSVYKTDSMLNDYVNTVSCNNLINDKLTQPIAQRLSLASLAYNTYHNNILGIQTAYSNLMYLSLAQQKYALVYIHANKLLNSYQIADPELFQEIYRNKHLAAIGQRDYKNALTYLDSFYVYKNQANVEIQVAQVQQKEQQQRVNNQQIITQLNYKNMLARNKQVALTLIGLLLLIIIIIVLYYKKQVTHNKLNQATLHQQLLRSQMNPHFMFNSLNALHYYILDNDGDNAATYLSKLSNLLRNNLNQSFNQKITIAEEVAALQQYMDLECYRYEGKNTFKVTVDAAINAEQIKIPHMLLQPFVENGFNHGLKHKVGKGHITLHITQQSTNVLVCTLTDNGVGRTAAQQFNTLTKHDSKALKIVTERMALLNKFETHKAPYSYTITDLYNNSQQPIGTTITLIIPHD